MWLVSARGWVTLEQRVGPGTGPEVQAERSGGPEWS
jgi:hypothetical protein